MDRPTVYCAAVVPRLSWSTLSTDPTLAESAEGGYLTSAEVEELRPEPATASGRDRWSGIGDRQEGHGLLRHRLLPDPANPGSRLPCEL